LGYEEKPLRVLQKLKENKQNPMFTLKHIKDSKPLTPPGDTNMSLLASPNLSPPPGVLGRAQSHKAATSLSNPNSFSPSRQVPKPTTSLSSSQHQHKNLPTSPQESSNNTAAGTASSQSTTSSTLRSLMNPLGKSTNKNSTQVHTNADNNSRTGAGNLLAGKAGLDAPIMAPSISAPTASSSTTKSQMKPEHFLGDLGLETGMADAIYSYMMNRSDSNGKDTKQANEGET
jgi:hypothetical protein